MQAKTNRIRTLPLTVGIVGVVLTSCAFRNSAPVASQGQKKDVRTITWQEQNMRFSVPEGWEFVPSSGFESEEFRLKGPQDAHLSVFVVDDRGRTIDVDSALRKYQDNLKTQQSVKFDEVRFLDLDAARGVLSVSTETDGDKRSLDLMWQGYRQQSAKLQFVSIHLWGPIVGPADRKNEFLNILNSLKLTKD